MHLITETFAQTFCYFIFINSKYFYIKKYFLNFKKYVLSIEEKHLKSHSEQWNVLQTYQSCCCQFRIPHFYCQSVLRKVWKSEGGLLKEITLLLFLPKLAPTHGSDGPDSFIQCRQVAKFVVFWSSWKLFLQLQGLLHFLIDRKIWKKKSKSGQTLAILSFNK